MYAIVCGVDSELPTSDDSAPAGEPTEESVVPDPEPTLCAQCGAVRAEGANFCSSCGHPHDAPVDNAPIDDEPGQALPRKWAITGAVAAVAFVLLIGVLIVNRDKPGPSNANARRFCDAMTEASKQIVDGGATSFEGLLKDPLKYAKAAAKADKNYVTLSAAVTRLSEDPTVSSVKGRNAIHRIAEACK